MLSIDTKPSSSVPLLYIGQLILKEARRGRGISLGRIARKDEYDPKAVPKNEGIVRDHIEPTFCRLISTSAVKGPLNTTVNFFTIDSSSVDLPLAESIDLLVRHLLILIFFIMRNDDMRSRRRSLQ